MNDEKLQVFVNTILELPLADIRKIRIKIHNYEKAQKPKKGESEVVKYTGKDMELATTLFDLMQVNYPSIKKEELGPWAEDIEKLHRIDKQPYELIEAAIVWSQNHGFWKRNIRSGAALRKHFEKICIQAKFDNEQKKGRIHSV